MNVLIEIVTTWLTLCFALTIAYILIKNLGPKPEVDPDEELLGQAAVQLWNEHP